MAYQSPLAIFSDKQIESLDLFKLRELKEELLNDLRFTFSETIKENGISMTKADIEDRFADLEKNLDVYLAIHKNRNLRSFFESSSLSFFENKPQLAALMDLNISKDKVDGAIAKHVSTFLPDLFFNQEASQSGLKALSDYTSTMSPENSFTLWGTLKSKLGQYITDLEEQHSSPFENEIDLKFKEEIGGILKPSFISQFTYFPESLNDEKKAFAHWANNCVVYNALKRSSDINKFSKSDLQSIRNAAYISKDFYNKEGNEKVVGEIDRKLKANQRKTTAVKRKKQESSGSSAWSILVGIFLVISFGLKIVKCANNQSRRNYNNTYNSNNQEYQDLVKKIERQARQSASSSSNKLKKLTENAGGHHSKYVNAKLQDVKMHSDWSEMTFHVDALPTSTRFFYKFLPESVVKKYQGQNHECVMTFINPDIKGAVMKHRQKFNISGDAGQAFNMHYNMKSTKDGEENLNIKRVPWDNFPLRGTISKLNTDGTVKGKSKFSISYSKTNKNYTVNYDNGKNMVIEKSELRDLPTSSTEATDSTKYKMILKNMLLLHKKYIKLSNYYTVNDLYRYKLGDGIKDNEIRYFGKKSATMRNYFTSSEDGTAYCEVKDDISNLKVFVDSYTGIIKGMHMMNANNLGTTIERIEVFHSK